MDITGIGAVADLAKTAINAIWPDKTEQEKAQLVAAVQLVQGQLAINQAEAQHPSMFVSGWRPFIGWVCGAGCAWNWIGLPVLKAFMLWYGYPLTISPADLSEMMPLLLGMLGLGGLRTYEKVQGVASK
jgi:dienelactone hydrolase